MEIRRYKNSFWIKGLIVVCLPLVSSSICIFYLTQLLYQTGSIADTTRQITSDVRVIDKKFLQLIRSGESHLEQAFNEFALGSPAELTGDAVAISPEARRIVERCDRLQNFTASEAKTLSGRTFADNAERIKAYSSVIADGLDIADQIDRFVSQQTKHSERSWCDWQQAVLRVRALTWEAIMISAALTLLLSVFIALDFLLRFMRLCANGERLARNSNTATAVWGNDELTFLDKALQQVSVSLSYSQQERKALAALLVKRLKALTQDTWNFLEGLSSLNLAASQREQLEFAKHIERTAGSLQSIDTFVNSIASVGEEAGAVETEAVLSAFSLSKTITTVFSNLASAAAAKSIRLQFTGTDQRVFSDQKALLRILTNLISNALKYSPANETIFVSIKATDREHFSVSVSDRGPGIPAHAAAQLFTPYYQTDQALKDQSFGLGLSICKKLVQALGGEIGYRPNLPKGSTFWFQLPMRTRSGDNQANNSGAEGAQFLTVVEWLWKSKISRVSLCLLAVPALSQLFIFSWLLQDQDSSRNALEKLRRQESVALSACRVQVNTFSAGYWTALYLATGTSEKRDLAEKYNRQTSALVSQLATRKGDDSRLARSLEQLNSLTRYQVQAFKQAQTPREQLSTQEIIGNFAHFVTSFRAQKEEMLALTEPLYDEVNRIAQDNVARQTAAQYAVYLAVLTNALICILLARLYGVSIARRIAALALLVRSIPSGAKIPRPARTEDELDLVQEHLALATEKLAQEREKRQYLLSSIAHDIRSPLQTVNVGLSSLSSKLPADQTETIQSILDNLQRAASQINDLLLLGKLEKPDSATDTDSRSLAEISRQVVSDMSASGSRKDLFIDLVDESAGKNNKRQSSTCADLLTRLLALAVDNAPPGSRLEIRLLDAKDATLVTFSDEGPSLKDRIRLPLSLEVVADAKEPDAFLSVYICQQLAGLSGFNFAMADTSTNTLYLESKT